MMTINPRYSPRITPNCNTATTNGLHFIATYSAHKAKVETLTYRSIRLRFRVPHGLVLFYTEEPVFDANPDGRID